MKVTNHYDFLVEINITTAWAVDREFLYTVVPARLLFRNVRFAYTKQLRFVKVNISRTRNPAELIVFLTISQT